MFIMGYTIGQSLNLQELKDTLKFNKQYHRKVYFPKWFETNFRQFTYQVIDMASPTKPLKCSDTFKIQGGYPHEVTKEQKENLENIQRDTYTSQREFLIPKLTAERFIELTKDRKNIIEFSTPHDSEYIRDIRVFDKDCHPDLVIIYVVNRKAQIISSWSVLKKNGKFKIKKPTSEEAKIYYELE